jgi:CheY-like chemotaxis protein
MDDNFLLDDFLKNDENDCDSGIIDKKYKVIIADDDKEVHLVTKMILRDFNFEGRGLEFIDAFSGKEAIEKVRENSDAAIILLDVVMEENDSGLKVVEEIRKVICNKNIRIILRTGQPGDAPEEKIITEYDINDYKLKTDLTIQKMFTTMYSSLRSYRDIIVIEKNKRGLEKIIKASSKLFSQNSLSNFLSTILYQLANFYDDSTDSLFIRKEVNKTSGFVCIDDKSTVNIVAATGRFERFSGMNTFNMPEIKALLDEYEKIVEADNVVEYQKNGFLIFHLSKNGCKNYIFIEGEKQNFDYNLIKLFLTEYSEALDTFQDKLG